MVVCSYFHVCIGQSEIRQHTLSLQSSGWRLGRHKMEGTKWHLNPFSPLCALYSFTTEDSTEDRPGLGRAVTQRSLELSSLQRLPGLP